MPLSRFFRDRRASVAPIFAIATIPLMGFVGAAIDYSRANSARTAMQAALDSTALMLSKEAVNLSKSELSKKAKDFFSDIYSYPEAKDLLIIPDLKVSQGNFNLVVTGSGKVDTKVARFLNQSQISFSATSQVNWGMKRLEVALALDNTGSMAWNNKMGELKKAVKSLLDTLEKAAKKPDDIKVAIIPFDSTVSIGKSYRDEPWINYAVNAIAKKKWEGCVEDRDQPHDVQDTAPGSPAALFPAANCSGGLADVLPLTNNWRDLRRRVDQMNPNGYTNVTIGLVWAWHALTSGAPLAEASPTKPDLEKVIILLTDGDNTENRWWKEKDSAKIDARTRAACANIKAANIKLYTIRVIEGNASLLKNCASNPSMYYDVRQASQLNTVFAAIAQNLANLHVAK